MLCCKYSVPDNSPKLQSKLLRLNTVWEKINVRERREKRAREEEFKVEIDLEIMLGLKSSIFLELIFRI